MTVNLLESPADAGEVWDRSEKPHKTEQRTVPLENVSQDFKFEQEFDIEIDYGQTRFPVEGEIAVHVADPQNSPIRLGYSDQNGTLEVIGWGFAVPLEQSSDLPRQIGRRFLELYSKAVTGSLRDEDRKWLRTVSEQMDYHAFAASRKLPRYREATLVRKDPVLLVQFLDDRNVKLDKSLTSKLSAIDDGERFSAWFTIDGHGGIADFNHVLRLPTMEEELAEMPAAPSPIELPPGVHSLLPKPEQE